MPTFIELKITYDPNFPTSEGPEGFGIQFSRIVTRTVSLSEMAYRALRCRSLVPQEVQDFNRLIRAYPRDEEQVN